MKLNHNKKSVKISLNLFALYAVLVCGIVFALPAFAADDPLVVVEMVPLPSSSETYLWVSFSVPPR